MYSIKEGILHKDGLIKICPFIQKVPQQKKVTGEIEFAATPCGDWCALFEVHEIEAKAGTEKGTMRKRAKLGCAETVYYDIEPDPENKISIVK